MRGSKAQSIGMGSIGLPISKAQGLKAKAYINNNIMNKALRKALIKEINNLDKNYHPNHIVIIENLLWQVYRIIKTDEHNVYTNSDSQNKPKSLTNKQLSLLNEEDKL